MTPVPVRNERRLSFVLRFYDAFLFPLTNSTPALVAPLQVSVPSLEWFALYEPRDSSYRFSAMTLTRAAPIGVGLEVTVQSLNDDYVNWEPLLVTLPRPVSTPPAATDFLIAAPLWPSRMVRPPSGETAVLGNVSSPTGQTVAGLKVQLWIGAALAPPPSTPYTRTKDNGDFVFRFPLLKAVPGESLSLRIQLDSNAVPSFPAVTNILASQTQVVTFQRN